MHEWLCECSSSVLHICPVCMCQSAFLHPRVFVCVHMCVHMCVCVFDWPASLLAYFLCASHFAHKCVFFVQVCMFFQPIFSAGRMHVRACVSHRKIKIEHHPLHV
eukprot:GDKI01003344.1.p2 GENE.GDKI01003344.1~~GDKI01003344.1.p2  ORF type:complete len:105 (+),score=25.46 GDKI01003344.1:108-422(+)